LEQNNTEVSERVSQLTIENSKASVEKEKMQINFDKSINVKHKGYDENIYELSNTINNLTQELREKDSLISELKMRVVDSKRGSFIVKSRKDHLKSYLDISDDQSNNNVSYLKKVLFTKVV
jgi:hypothetical protein